MHVVHVCRRTYRNILVEFVMISPDAGLISPPPRGAGIQRDIRRRIMYQKGNTVPRLQSFEPPVQIVSEGLLQVYKLASVHLKTSSSFSFCSQNPVEEKPACKEYITSIK